MPISFVRVLFVGWMLAGGAVAAGLDGSYLWKSRSGGGSEELYHFRPDGWLHRGVPAEDPSRMDLEQLRQRSPELVGRYVLEGNQLVIHWADATSPVRVPLRTRPDGALEMAGGVAQRIPRLDGATRLLGAYTAKEETRAFAAGSPAVVRSKTLKFAPDGSWMESEAEAVTTGPGPTVGSTSSVRTEAGGLFRIEGSELVLGGADGSLSKHFVFPLPEPGDAPGRPARLIVDGRVYQREP